MQAALVFPPGSVERRDTAPCGSPLLARLIAARGEAVGPFRLLALRVAATRYLVPFASAFVTWCVALLCARPGSAPLGLALGFGLALADVLACLGVIAARRLDAIGAARRSVVLTTTQEFPAIPMPDYLIPEMPPLYEPDVALQEFAPADREPLLFPDGWAPARAA